MRTAKDLNKAFDERTLQGIDKDRNLTEILAGMGIANWEIRIVPCKGPGGGIKVSVDYENESLQCVFDRYEVATCRYDIVMKTLSNMWNRLKH
jgi:hypothetical protein